MRVEGRYVNGIGKASKVAQSPERKALLNSLFGCPLIGTFNILTDKDTSSFPPSFREGIHRFNLIRIELPDGQWHYGWSYRWDGSRQKKTILEIYTKIPLSQEYKTNPLSIEFYHRWTDEQIKKWQNGKYWFQGFDWLPTQRGDSQKLWKLMDKEAYTQKTVLDFGTHYGFFAFQASKRGAIVEAIDQSAQNIAMATTINNHIEQQDIQFVVGNTLPNKQYDYIFELSVYHWIDESYQNLSDHLVQLKNRCRFLYLELINPPLRGQLTQAEVDRIVGGERLLHYRHNVRRMRTLYKLKGHL
jgi:2-polyprenyl-3-methyl-5-hydroxy-6-metoxy-1,4-benzoquinol methylase